MIAPSTVAAHKRPPVVTDDDRAWAESVCPAWLRGERLQETIDDGRSLDDVAGLFVAEQAEAFEKRYAGERLTFVEWSSLWRRQWFPRADPEKRFPIMAKRKLPKVPHPFFRMGSAQFARAMSVATQAEKRMWRLCRVAQFKPDDPRLAIVDPKLNDGTETP